MVKSISVNGLKQKMDDKKDFILVDCREEEEHKFCHIRGATLIPVSRFKKDFQTHLNQDDEIIICGHRDGSSRQVCLFLLQQGFQNVSYVKGGIEEWSLKIDRKILRY